MKIETQYNTFIEDVKDICSHISLRHSESGDYIFALGLKETHTLQMRKVKEKFVLELWHGANSDIETVISEPIFEDIELAFKEARMWLEKDAT